MYHLFTRTAPSTSPSISIPTLLLLALALPTTTLVRALLPTGFNLTIPQYGFDGLIPSSVAATLPSACAAAYRAPIDCDVRILISPTLAAAKAQSQDAVCTAACAASMLAYEKKVVEECTAAKGVVAGTPGLKGSWLEFVMSGRAGVGVYWKHCLRDLTTNDLCVITQADYELAWNAATADTPEQGAVRAFCSNNCLTQTIVLNVGTQDNLNELSRMCGSQVDIAGMPFIGHMVFAGLIRVADASAMQEGVAPDPEDSTPLIPAEGGVVGSAASGMRSGGFLAIVALSMSISILTVMGI